MERSASTVQITSGTTSEAQPMRGRRRRRTGATPKATMEAEATAEATVEPTADTTPTVASA